jgi:SAM-dependent methyltransferase
LSYKVYLPGRLDSIEWSQAAWRLEGHAPLDDCDQALIHDVLLRNLPTNGLIADAGCGTAKWATYLRRRGYRVLGIEISPNATAIARERDPAIPLLIADTRRTPIRSRVLDAVISLGVVEHDEAGPEVALHELHRILKPGGLLVLDVPYNSILRRLLVNRLQTWVTWRRRRRNWPIGFNEYRFSASEVRRFLERAGFEVVSVHPNDCRPPKNVGLWVDWQNLTFSPLRPLAPDELFVVRGMAGRVACGLVRRTPWLVCGEVTFIARAV